MTLGYNYEEKEKKFVVNLIAFTKIDGQPTPMQNLEICNTPEQAQRAYNEKVFKLYGYEPKLLPIPREDSKVGLENLKKENR